MSRPSVIGTLLPVLSTTRVCTSPHISNALSTFAFNGVFLPPLGASSAVTMSEALQPSTRAANASGENPAKTMEWIAPILAHASMAYAASGIIGI